MAVGYDYELYVDGARVFYASETPFYIDVEADGFVDTSGMARGSYTYEEGAYLGWTTTQGGTTPDYEVGDTINVTGKVYLFSISATSGGSMYLGTSTISKMYLGNTEVSKVYLGQDLVYEKQASGFSVDVTLNNRGDLNYAELDIYDGLTSTTPIYHLAQHNVTSTTNVTLQCSSGYLVISGTANGDPQDDITLNTSSSNNVVVVSESGGSGFRGQYQITGNATLVADCYYSS